MNYYSILTLISCSFAIPVSGMPAKALSDLGAVPKEENTGTLMF